MQLNKEEYVDLCWDKVEYYIKGIDDDTIKSNKDIKLAIQRFKNYIKDERVEFKVEKVDRVFKFFYYIRIRNGNIYERFDVLPFQAFIIAELFGFYWKDSDYRVHNYALLFMGKKNGKTSFAAALQLYFMIGDGVLNPESLLVASTRSQAGIALKEAVNQITHSPALNKRLKTFKYEIRFKDPKKGGFAKVLPGNFEKLDGFNVSGAILDEIHSYKDDNMYSVIKSSTIARENSMIFLITTGGQSLTSFGVDQVNYAKNILNNTIKDDSYFALLYALEEGDDYKDTENWIKANPALGKIITVNKLMKELNQSQYSQSKLNAFLAKHMNIFTEEESDWIEDAVLNKCLNNFDLDQFLGCKCYIGLDLSAVDDLTALVLLFIKDDKYYLVPYFFMNNQKKKYFRNSGVNLLDWIRDKQIIKIDKPTIDFDFIYEFIRDLNEKYDIQSINYDPANSRFLVNKLYDTNITMTPFQQSLYKFNEPLKDLEMKILNGDVIFNNEVLKWNFNNVVIHSDGNNNQKIMKNKSKDSVDGAVAATMAVGGYLDSQLGAVLDTDVWSNN